MLEIVKLKNNMSKGTRPIVLMDNASFHRALIYHQHQTGSIFDFLFNGPYTP
jgi:hypothetical protein